MRTIGRWWLAIFCLAGITLSVATVFYSIRRPWSGLPYRDSFAAGEASEWIAYGGTWQLADGAMRNDSDERGAKLTTGSPNWRDYSFTADVELLGRQGDAGLMLRSSNEEQGVDSYRGYYTGLRTNDNNVIIGLADYGWIELAVQPMPGGVHPFQWYHLKATVHGCQVTATATEIATGRSQTVSVNDKHCVASGRVGLRSHSSGGVWKNLLVAPLNGAQMEVVHAAPPVAPPRLSYAIDEPVMERSSEGAQGAGADRIDETGSAAGPVESVGSLRLIRTHARRATVRGTVILTSPTLFVQDALGGVAVMTAGESHLKIGDEVEVTGEVGVHDFSCVIRNASVRLLWAHAPAPPIAVTPNQAATGAFDAMFIEVDGSLTAREAGPDNTLLLTLKSEGQSFRAVIHPGRGNAIARNLGMRSMLRLRGVCVVDPQYTHSLTPFVLLIPSSDDIDVLAGPPWYSARNLLLIGLVALTLAMMIYLLYIQAKHWRLHAIVDERERIAHEMHDTLAQCFVGIGFQLQAISNGMPESMQAINQQLDIARELVRHSHEEASRSLSTLRREFLESEALHTALNAFACRMVENGCVRVQMVISGDESSTPYRVKDALFRIGQEAIANSLRHANPSVLTIEVAYTASSVKMLIEDNGSGFVPAGGLRGFGLTGMRKRAEEISAVFHLASSRGVGTQVKVVAPMPPRFTFWKAGQHIWTQGRGGRTNAKRSDKENPYSYRR